MLSTDLRRSLEQKLTQHFGQQTEITDITSVSGGDINDAFRISTNVEQVFVKRNSTKRFPGMFETEQKGLELLRKHTDLGVPQVLFVHEKGDDSILAMEFLQQGDPGPEFWHNFGTALAKMHRASAPSFGLDHHNYIGSLPQHNTQHSSWEDFFVLQRLEPQVKLAIDANAMERNVSKQFSKLYTKVGQLFPEEPPALLHGDLWNGNYMIEPDGRAAIFDPAVYFGHREMDLAMSKLFGGFAPEFYQSYHHEYPLEEDWQRRIGLANLYPLMVHVNLFGGGYANQVKQVLSNFV